MTKTKRQKALAAAARRRAAAQRGNPNNNNRGGPVVRAGTTGNQQRITAPVASSSRDSSYFDVSSGPKQYKNSVLLRGRDILAPVSAGAAAPVTGEVLYNGLVDAIDAFEGTRLARFFALYEKFLFKRLKFDWKPACSTEVGGQVMIAYDRDPSDPNPPESFHGLQQYAAMEGTTSSAPWTPFSVNCPLSDSQDFYYTNEAITGVNDERLFAQGQVYVVASSDFAAGIVNQPLGTLWCDWECVLFDPQLQDDDAEIVTSRTVPGDTAVPTTSNAGWNALLSGNVEKIGNGASWGSGFDGTNVGVLLPRGTWDITWFMPTTATNVAGLLDATLNVYDGKTKELIEGSVASYLHSAINGGNISGGSANWLVSISSLAGAWILPTVINTAPKRGGTYAGSGEFVKAVKTFPEYISK